MNGSETSPAGSEDARLVRGRASRTRIPRPRQFARAHGWPLDRLLVGVGTLRTLRELIRQERREGGASAPPRRAWDVALFNDVTPQGASVIMERLHELGVVARHPPSGYGRADRYRLRRVHPLVAPMERLFEEEWRVISKLRRKALRERRRVGGERLRE